MDYESKKQREIAQHEQTQYPSLASRILRHPLLYSSPRHNHNYIFPKKEMAKWIQSHLPAKVETMLIAPCSDGNEMEYLGEIAQKYYGIDLSPTAIARCPKTLNAKTGDILESGYADNSFDLVVSSLFFHHMVKVGFTPFLKEFKRILKPSGNLVILEPSIWYPVNVLTRPLKLLGNPYGEVPDESPFRPGRMVKELKQAGFKDVEIRAATFSHCSFFVPMADAINRITKPLLDVSPFKYSGWMVMFWGRK